ADALRGVKAVRARQLVDGNYGAGLAIQTTDRAVVLCAQLDSGHIFHAHDPAIRILAHDDVAELFQRSQASPRQQRIGKLLITGSRLATYLASRIDGILSLDGVDDVGSSDAQFRQLIRLYPEPHRILTGSVDVRPTDAVGAADGIIEVNVRVIRQKCGVAGTAGRVQGVQQERSR